MDSTQTVCNAFTNLGFDRNLDINIITQRSNMLAEKKYKNPSNELNSKSWKTAALAKHKAIVLRLLQLWISAEKHKIIMRE
jgi:hypothetical protein